VLLDCSQRFANPGPEFASNLTESVKNVLSLGRLNLFLIQNVSRAAVPGAQAQNILASKARNRAFNDCSASGPLTDLPREFRSEPRIIRLSHQGQRALNLLVRNQAQ